MKTIQAEIELQDGGVIALELYPETAPISVENFVKLARDGFYDGVIFHRVVPGFVIQGEFRLNGVKNDLKHTRGVLSMARAQAYDSAGSQFFIMVEDAPHLDGQYAAFGRVTNGMDVVDKIVEDSQNGVTAEMKTVRIL